MGAVKILIVDDEKLVTWSLEKALSKNGYEVNTAQTATEALKIAADSMFNVLITDLRLPDGDGIETAGMIRDVNPEIKVIVITAYGSGNVKERARQIGAFDFFDKPFLLDEIRSSVKKALAKE